MEGYDDRSYGRAFADVYDDWYRDISDVHTTIADLVRLAGSGPVLELGIGTGRLAVPLAQADPDLAVVGIDSSPEMLGRLGDRMPPPNLTAHVGDMVDDLPIGPFTLVFVAYNTLFNLTTAERQRRCFSEVAGRLTLGGRFVVEAFVPDEPPRDGDLVEVRTLAADRVVLSISRHDARDQRAEGQFVELSETDGVRLRPWSIRYASPAELDAMAAAVGFELEMRWESFGGLEWQPESARHVSVYRLGSSAA
ncbi:MAG: class I SAM-dependent methyltransferase [Ilumatobacteraceae bacterium]